MVKQIRDSFIWVATVSGISKGYRERARKECGPLVRVLVFHDVTDVDWFRTTIKYLKDTHNILSPDDFIHTRFDAKKINVLITFDDGYTSWVEIAHPILKANGVKALFFVNSGLADSYQNEEARSTFVREKLLLSKRNTISWEGVQQLKEEGHMIGGHTIHHARLSAISLADAEKEINDDKHRIEEVLGQKVRLFAYPFGTKSDYTEEVKRVVHRAGYAYGFTTESSFVSGKDSMAVPRLCLEDSMSVQKVKQWVEGGYDVFQKFKRICVR